MTARDQEFLSGWLFEARAQHARLRDILSREQQALIRRQSGDLESAVDGKRVLLDQIRRHELSLQQWLHTGGCPAMRDAIEARVRECGGQTLLGQWRDLRLVAETNRDQNRANGMLVEQYRRHLERAIAVLSGQPSETPGYGKTAAPATAGRLLAST